MMSEGGERSGNASPNRLAKLQNIPGLILDELTEYAMAKEGIEIKDLEPK